MEHGDNDTMGLFVWDMLWEDTIWFHRHSSKDPSWERPSLPVKECWEEPWPLKLYLDCIHSHTHSKIESHTHSDQRMAINFDSRNIVIYLSCCLFIYLNGEKGLDWVREGSGKCMKKRHSLWDQGTRHLDKKPLLRHSMTGPQQTGFPIDLYTQGLKPR